MPPIVIFTRTSAEQPTKTVGLFTKFELFRFEWTIGKCYTEQVLRMYLKVGIYEFYGKEN
jgi:hypothetical protein